MVKHTGLWSPRHRFESGRGYHPKPIEIGSGEVILPIPIITLGFMVEIREVLRWPSLKPQLISDGVTALLLGVFFSLGLKDLALVGMERLISGTYASLALGVLVLYLLLDVNQKLAFFAHTVTFPFVSLFYFFLSWLPGITWEALYQDRVHQLFENALVYVVLLTGFLLVNFYFYLERSRTSQDF